MRVLSIVHQADAGGGVFHDVVREAGHALEVWMPPERPAPAEPAEAYDAALVFGGAANVDEEERHPWLVPEKRLLRRVRDSGTPTLGVCLGSQLLAEALGADVGPATRPEVGWYPLRLEPAARDDPVLGGLPEGVCAFEWHGYGFGPPPGATPLARTDTGLQAFRAGAWWGVQFHAEVTAETALGWIAREGDGDRLRRRVGVDRDALREATRQRIAGWNACGRELCGRFLAFAACR